MKVAYFTTYIPHYRKGVLEYLHQKEDINLSVYGAYVYPGGFSLIKPQECSFKYCNMKTYTLKIPLINLKLHLQPLSTLSILKSEYDVYIFSNSVSNISVFFNLLLGKILKRKICIWGSGRIYNKGPLYNKMKKLYLDLAKSIIFYTEKIKNNWIVRGIDRNKLFVAFNAIDNKKTEEIRNEISYIELQDFKIKNSIDRRKNIIFIGRLLKNRKLNLLVDAIKILKNSIGNINVIIIGDGPEKDILKNYIKDNGLEKFIHLFGAIYNEKDIAKFLLSSQIFVIPSYGGLSIQHSLEYRLPVIVGNNLENHGPEISLIKQGFNGLFFEDDNSEDLAEKILLLLKDENLYRKLSENAPKIIKEKYNLENMGNGIYSAITHAYNN